MYSAVDSSLKKCDAGEKDQCQIGYIKYGMRERVYLFKSDKLQKCQIGAYVVTCVRVHIRICVQYLLSI